MTIRLIYLLLLSGLFSLPLSASWYWPFGNDGIDVKKVPEVRQSGKYRVVDPLEKANRVHKKQDPAEGVSVDKLRKLAKAGNANAQLSLGKIYFDGLAGEKQSYKKAFKWFMEAAENGNPEAMYNVAICYDGGFGRSTDMEKAISWYLKAAEAGVPEAQLKSAVFAEARGDAKTAFKFYKALADDGNEACMSQTALFLLNGYGTTPDPKSAVSYWTKAAQHGNIRAQIRLADCYQQGLGVPRNYTEMVKWLELASLDGDPEAQAKLGKCCEDGMGTARNPESAFRWYKISAEANYPLGMYFYGKCHQDGIGTVKNAKVAFDWFKKASEAGEVLADFSLYECYRDGKGTNISPEKARQMLVKAAEEGVMIAKAQLAIDLTEEARGKAAVLEAIPQEALKLIKAVEGSPDSLAKIRLAIWYLTSVPPSSDPERGRQLLKNEVEAGTPGARDIYKLYFGDERSAESPTSR